MNKGLNKQIVVEYFALLVQEAKISKETLKTEAETIEQLFQECKMNHQFSLGQSQVRAAINQKLVSSWHTPISDGDHILFIPPLVGG